MLEVSVKSDRPPPWEWQVTSNGEMIANGFEDGQIEAKFERYDAMFLLLAGRLCPTNRSPITVIVAVLIIAASMALLFRWHVILSSIGVQRLDRGPAKPSFAAKLTGRSFASTNRPPVNRSAAGLVCHI